MPEQKECAENWQIAIGLQGVENLKVSLVLLELILKFSVVNNIHGKKVN